MENKNTTGTAEENIIIGRNPVIEALKSDTPIDTIYMDGNGGSLGLIRKLAREKGIVVKDAQPKKLDQLSGGASHQVPAASMSRWRRSWRFPQKRALSPLSSFVMR